jgi:hypothetical protein
MLQHEIKQFYAIQYQQTVIHSLLMLMFGFENFSLQGKCILKEGY